MKAYRARLVDMQCIVCKRHPNTGGGEIVLHHVAEGSGKRSPWALVPICAAHHIGSIGFHGMGSKAFCRIYRPPGDSEYGLLIWLLEDLHT